MSDVLIRDGSIYRVMKIGNVEVPFSWQVNVSRGNMESMSQ